MPEPMIILHPDVDPGVDWAQVGLLNHLDVIGQRVTNLNVLESAAASGHQRMAILQARSAYLRQARKILDQLADSGFLVGGRDRFYTPDELLP